MVRGQAKRNTKRNTKRNAKRQKGGMEPLLVERDPRRINPSSDSDEYEDVWLSPWHSRRLRGISSSSEDGLTPLPSPTPNEVGYIHPELGSPDEDIPLYFNIPLARVKNFRLAIYKNKHDDSEGGLIIKIHNQIEGLDFGVISGSGNSREKVIVGRKVVGRRGGEGISFGDPQEVVLVSTRNRITGAGRKGAGGQRDSLGNMILTLRAQDRMNGIVEPAYDLTFNIPESDKNATYVIYQDK